MSCICLLCVIKNPADSLEIAWPKCFHFFFGSSHFRRLVVHSWTRLNAPTEIMPPSVPYIAATAALAAAVLAAFFFGPN